MKEKDDEMKSEQSSSDTTDVDEVDDIDELLNTGQPVYFNYAMPKDVPKSLVVSYSIRIYSRRVIYVME